MKVQRKVKPVHTFIPCTPMVKNVLTQVVTLLHKKYYDMNAYKYQMNALLHGELLPACDKLTYDVNADLKVHSSAHKRKVIKQESYVLKGQIMELRKVQNECIEVCSFNIVVFQILILAYWAGKMKLLRMDLLQNLGVRMDGTTFENQ